MRSFYARVEHKAVVGVDFVNLLAVNSLIFIRRHRGEAARTDLTRTLT